MEFWAVEVKSGEPLFVQPGDGMVLHLSQAGLGELKKGKGSEPICLFVKVDEKKLVLGNLFSDKLPQQQFDLVFDKDFELSHNWKNGSVYFYGYRANNPFDESDDEDEFGSEEDIPILASNNGKPAIQAIHEKPAVAEKPNVVKDTSSGKHKVKIVEPNKDVKPDEDDDSDEPDHMSADNYSDSEEDDESDSQNEEEDESDEEDEETPKKVEIGKKRATESATKTLGPDKKAKTVTPTLGPDKKAKTVTPKKTDSKKGGGHVATPHPAKQAGKTPANKSNQQTSKSGGSNTCKSCNRTFNSENALDSHTKAKHSGGK